MNLSFLNNAAGELVAVLPKRINSDQIETLRLALKPTREYTGHCGHPIFALGYTTTLFPSKTAR